MTDTTFITQLKKALGSHTVYGSGAFGASIGNYPSQATRYYNNTLEKCGQTEANKVLKEAKTKPCYSFDCCGLIKGILWGWNAIPNSIYGGANYESNGVPDVGAGAGKYDLISYCTDVSTDFSKIVPGEMLWLNGHVGVYIGNDIAIECTTAWTGNVLKSVVTNIRTAKSGEYGRRWDKHGKLKWVSYTPTQKYSVIIGEFNTKAEAESVQSALKVLGTSSIIK